MSISGRGQRISSAALETWLTTRIPGAGRVGVSDVRSPAGNGYFEKTLLFTARWRVHGTRREERFALRADASETCRVFPVTRFEDEYRLAAILDQHTDIPVPRVYCYEPDRSVLGARFFLMRRVDGLVPPDLPSHHQQGWVTALSPAERARMWWQTLDVLARLHRLDIGSLGLAFLDRPAYGPTGLAQRLGYYERYMRWAHPGPQPVAEAALAWLRAHQPEEPDPPCLLWGDARLGNAVFADAGLRAVLDWEAAVLGQPEEDLVCLWHSEQHQDEGGDVPRLAGFPDFAETRARYEELHGRPMRHLPYYEVLTLFKGVVGMAHVARTMIERKVIPRDSDYPYNNPLTHRLAQRLGLAVPERPPLPPAVLTAQRDAVRELD